MCKPVIPYFILGRIIKSSKTELVSVKELVWVTSLLVTDVGDEMGWWQLHDVGDSFSHFGYRHQLSFYISVEHQQSKDVTKIEILSPKSTNSRQL